jgi:hypothetical protein
MLDQDSFLSGSEIDIPIYEDTEKGAAFRTSNLDNQFQRPIFTARGKKSSAYKATVTLKTCIHGHLDKSVAKPIPATLIVLEYSLNALDETKYATAFTSLEFQPYSGPGATGPVAPAPTVVAWSPHTSKGNVSTVKESKEKDRKFEGLNLNVLGNGGGIDMSVGNATTTDGTRTYFQLVQSDKSLSGNAGTGYDGVWWHLAQNAYNEDGVPPKLVTAVLVQRESESAKFQCTFVLNVEAKWWHKARAKWERFWGIVVDDPVWFDPTLPAVGGDLIPPCLDEYLGHLKVDDLGSFENPPVVA